MFFYFTPCYFQLNDIRRKPGSHSHDGVNDKPDRGTAEPYGRDGTGITGTGQTASVLSGAEPEFADIKQRVNRTAESFARYRRTALPDRTAKSQNRTVGKRESAMAGINAEAEQREQLIAETEQRITDLKQQIEKGFALYCYDYKFPDLSEIAYNHLLNHLDGYKVKPKFYVKIGRAHV